MLKQYDTYVVGYYGMQNSGDDALLLATLWGCENFLGDSRFQISNTAPLNPERYGKRPSVLKSNTLFRGQNRSIHYMNAALSKKVVFGGGSVLHTQSDIDMKRHMMKLSSQKKSMALGIGIENFKDVGAEKSCAKFLNECGVVALRDQSSYDIAESIAPHANLIKSFDLAPLLTQHPNFSLYEGKRKGILVNICPVPKDAHGRTNPKSESDRLAKLAETLESVYRNTEETITLFDFNGHFSLGDWQLSHKLAQKLDGKVPVNLEPYESDPLALLHKMSSYKLVVAMRLHANVFAYLANTPAISINYHPKCIQWAKQIGLSPDYQFDAASLSPLALKQSILNALTSGEQGVTFPVEDAVKQSLKNWSYQYETAKNICRHTALQ